MKHREGADLSRRAMLGGSLAGLVALAGLRPAFALTPIWMGEVIGRTTDRNSVQRFYIRIQRPRQDAPLIDIARFWHRREPKSLIWFFDDKAEIERVIRVHNGLAPDRRDYPLAWVKAHTIAHIGQRRWRGETRWVLMRGLQARGTPIAVLDA